MKRSCSSLPRAAGENVALSKLSLKMKCQHKSPYGCRPSLRAAGGDGRSSCRLLAFVGRGIGRERESRKRALGVQSWHQSCPLENSGALGGKELTLPPPSAPQLFVTFSKWPTWLGITITIKQDGWGLTTNTVAVSSRMSAIKHEAREALTFPLFEMNGDINIHCFVALTSDVLRSPSPLLIYYF